MDDDSHWSRSSLLTFDGGTRIGVAPITLAAIGFDLCKKGCIGWKELLLRTSRPCLLVRPVPDKSLNIKCFQKKK